MPSPVHPYSDYGVALRTLRSARGWLAFMMFACVLAQFIGFYLMWWTQQPYQAMKPQWRPVAQSTNWEEVRTWMRSATHPSTEPASRPAEVFFPGTEQSRKLNIRNQWDIAYTMVVPVTQIAALIAVSSQAIIVLVTLMIVLVAQAPGVAQMTRSLIWSVLLLFMFFPWQYFAREFPIPGVIYSYSELLRLISPQLAGDRVYGIQVWLVYFRFLGWPVIGLLALLITSERYRAGVMIAIGHPLQSILQPRGGPMPSGMGKPLAPLPGMPGKKMV